MVAAIEPTYPPLNTIKPVAADIWIVDGPLIRFGPPGLKAPFPTRMTILRLDCGLFVHSPTALDDGLKSAIAQLGPVRWLVAPNAIHYWWLPDWKAAFADAEVYVAPGALKRAGDRITFPTIPLTGETGHPWDATVATLPVAGRFLTEFVFFHRTSRTLILTDLIENFEPRKLGPAMRWLVRLGGVADPDGGMPRDMRLGFLGQRAYLRRAIRTMIDWNPERVILAHGRWYERGGAAELRRAFRWLRP